jgi:hypothetical protein
MVLDHVAAALMAPLDWLSRGIESTIAENGSMGRATAADRSNRVFATNRVRVTIGE